MNQLNFNDSCVESSKKNWLRCSFFLSFLIIILSAQNLFAQDNDPPVYCTAGFFFGCTTNDGIYSVKDFVIQGSGISHIDIECPVGGGFLQAAYGDYTSETSLQGNLYRGQTYSFTLNNTSFGGMKIWIDFDGNGDFDSAGEMVFWTTQLSHYGSVTGTFTVPDTAPLITSRMRVIYVPSADDTSVPYAPCDLQGYFGGGVFDYSVSILPQPDCYMPTLVSTSNISDISADVLWAGVGTFYDIEYGEQGFTQGDGTIVNGITTNSYNLTGLTSETVYHYYIRQSCETDVYSDWSGPYLFKTLCAPVDSFFENFDSYGSGNFTPNQIVPDCWNKIISGGSQFIAPVTPPNYELQLSNTSQEPIIMVLPPVTNINAGTHWLRFKARIQLETGYLQIGYITDINNTDTFVEILPITITNTSYEAENAEYMAVFPTNIPANARIAVRNPGISSGFHSLDDVYWEVAPDCIPPLNINISNLGENSVDLSWVSDGTSFEVEYGEAGFIQNNGTTITDVSNLYTLEGLTPNTEYDYYVRQDCGNSSYSNWSGPFTFKTWCSPVSTIIENFDDLTTEYSIPPPDCWDMIIVPGSTINDLVVTTSGPPASTGTYRIRQRNSTIAILPPVNNINSGTHWLKLKAVVWMDSQVAQLQVGYVTDINNISTFVEILQLTIDSIEWSDSEYTIPYTSDIPANARIAIRSVESSSMTEIYWDDLRWEPATDCIFPINLKTTNISDQSTVLSWVSDGTVFDIEYGLEGFNLGEGTIISEVGNNYTITGLNLGTSYDYYVRRDCGNGDYSIWTGPFSFTPGAYLGNIPTSLNQNPVVSDSACGHLFSIEVPEGQQIASLNVKYSMLSTSSAWTSQQRSVLYSPTLGAGENEVTQGENVNFPGYEEYTRNVTFANGATGIVDFELKAWRTQGGTDCGTDLIYVMNGTWKLTPTFEPIPTCSNPATNLGYTNITEDSVDLIWTAEEGIFQVKWGNSGFDDETAGTTISGITTNSYTLQELDSSVFYEFYVRRDCSTEEGEDFGEWIGPFKFNSGYCIPTSTTAHYFTLFSTTNAVENIIFSYPDSDLGTGYKDETDMVVVQNAGSSFNFSSNYIGGPSGLRIWIDWNNDFIFEDSEEVYYLGGAGAKTGSITVPEDAINGDYRMRVRTQSGTNSVPSACGNIATGEGIDFTLRVQNGTSSTIDFNSFGFGYHPNPVSEVLYLRTNTEIKEVFVFNMLGQQLNLPIQSNKTHIDMTGLPSGNYVMSVTIEDVTKTFKIVKN